jgi:hypothetical protein
MLTYVCLHGHFVMTKQGIFRAPTPEEAASGEGLIGRKVNIFWSGTGEFFVARVSFFS